jgi:TP901 family phage tail tape measure protein
MANTEKIVVQVVVQGEKQLDNLNKKSGQATKKVGGLTKGLAGMTAGVLTASAAFQKISQVVGNAIKTFTKFEFEMAKVRAITGSTDRDFKKLTNTAQQLGRSTFFTASQVAELQVNFGKLGFSTTEILEAQEATLMLATATQSDLGRAAIVAGAAVRGFGLDASETQRVVDVMAVAFTSSALDIEKFQTSMTKVAPISAAAGISIESTSAVMGTLTDAGIEASIAGTSLRNIFLKMQDPASDLSQHLGFTVESTDDLEKALMQLNNEGLSNAEMMQLVDLRQVAAFQTMVSGAARVLDLTDALEDANGEAQKMADIMADTLQGDILKAKSAWEGLEIAIMTGGSNMSKSIRAVVSDWTKFISGVVDEMRTPEQVGSDFLKESLNSIKATQAEMDKMSGTTATNSNKKSRGDIILDEIERLESLNSTREKVVKLLEIEGEKFGARGVSARQLAEDEQKNIEARRFALEELNLILDEELKNETNKRKNADLQRDIEIEKQRRANLEKSKKLAEEARKKDQEDFKQSQTDLKNALQEELNAEKENLINGLITKEEFDSRVFEAEQAHLENMRNLNISYGQDVAAITGQLLDNELNRIQTVAEAEKAAFDKKNKEDKEEKKERQQKITEMQDIGNQLIYIAGEEENLQGVKKAGIAISRAAAIASSFEAMADYGKAIASAGADSPWYLKIINVVGLIAAMASTLSLIKSMKNSFGDGGVIDTFANGGMVNGKSHAQGGEKFAVGGRVVELEGGEAVINKRSTAMFRNQLSAMNSAGGGVKFADGGLLNMPSFSQQQFNALGQNQMMGAMGSGGKVVVVEADITDSQNLVSVIQADAKI